MTALSTSTSRRNNCIIETEMARGGQRFIEVKMNKTLTEYSQPTENMTEGDCSGCSNDTSEGKTVESKEGENVDETTSKVKKKNKSEKQKERVRQYKKKIRKARRQMAAVKRVEEANNNTGQPANAIRPLEANEVAKGPNRADLLLPREILLEPVSTQLKPADGLEIQVLISPTQTLSDKDIHDNVIPDNSTMTNDDVFGILSVYVESSLHFEFNQDSSDQTRNDHDFGYVYFSMSDLLK